MALHFSLEEFDGRIQKVLKEMDQCGLDGVLMFRQESMYYLTGYDTFGYVFFQCMYLGSDGDLVLLTRSPDLLQAKFTSIIEDVRVWIDGSGASPMIDLREILVEKGCQGKRLGVEYDAYGFTAMLGRQFDQSLSEFCQLLDVSDMVSKLRAVKSTSELTYIRKAAQLSDEALKSAHDSAHPDAYEGEILAKMQSVVFKGGGDYPANDFIIGSGQGALLCRSYSGFRCLDDQDQLTLEFSGVYRHYHAPLMRTIPIGRALPLHNRMHGICIDAMSACMDALRPGDPVGQVFDAYAKVCDRAGMGESRLNATGYGVGATFSPSWMDWPMCYRDNPIIVLPGMVFFLHMILMDDKTGQAMCLGHTVAVNESGCYSLSELSLDLVVK